MAKKAIYAPASAMSAAHEALYQLQTSRNGKYLTYDQAIKVLLSAPGFTFGTGGTASSFLEGLAEWNFVTVDSVAERVTVHPWEEQSQHNCTESQPLDFPKALQAREQAERSAAYKTIAHLADHLNS